MSISRYIKEKILILDGAMGTMIQKHGLSQEEYQGNNEYLNLIRPDIIKSVHREYIAAGADIIESNTFSANRISQSEYGCAESAYRMAFEGVRLAREAADEAHDLANRIGLERKVWVAGSIGPTSKSLSLSPDASDPSFRHYSFDQVKAAYKEQVEAMIKAGADLLLIETCFDALNTKAALAAIQECPAAPPVMVSVSVGDRSGRTLTGQTLEAFYTSIGHYPLLSFGLNCSLGAAEMYPLLKDISIWCRCAVSCYPNAGLPNEMGGYDQSPENMAAAIKTLAENGLVNIVGGCCGTTPEHIRAIAEAVRGCSPRKSEHTEHDDSLKVSGLETVAVDRKKNNFLNIGERTNVAGSRKFARLVSEKRYEEALQIAARQIEDGAAVIDINMDDAMLDSTVEMERFVRYISNDPTVARAALMIDSSHWETIMAGLKNAQGKCIVNSISLKDGEEEFVRKAKAIKSMGAAMVVMAFDEQGQATTFDRKTEICARAYSLLTEKAGISPKDIIFDVNILSIGTGVAEHARYAVDFIEAVRWIKQNLPGALTSGGVSNLSFSFRGNNAVREAMHSAFLYHAIEAGLDMAIVNPSMLQIYDQIDPDLLRCVEDVIFNRDSGAVERLTEKASALLAAKDTVPGLAETDETATNPVSERLKEALVRGSSKHLETDLMEAYEMLGSAVSVIEGPLMDGMEEVGRLFSDGRMFLPQVIKSAKVMKDSVEILNPLMPSSETSHSKRPKIILATVKGDVHDIGKNITGIIFSCNGFEVHDLGVMVEKEKILDEAERTGADIIAVSGLITPSLYQMEEICREMTARGMTLPLFVGGATTSALHTAVKLSPLYGHVFHGADSSAAGIMAKRYMMDPEGFEQEQHMAQEKLRSAYDRKAGKTDINVADTHPEGFSPETYMDTCPKDIICMDASPSDILQYFDWRMFYAIWGVKYGSSVPEAAELLQLKRDAEDELFAEDYRISICARFLMGSSSEGCIYTEDHGKSFSLPMMRQENGKCLSLSDFVIDRSYGRTSPFGIFAISVHKRSKAHTEGCSCPACSNRYEDFIGRTVRQTIAEAASIWLDKTLSGSIADDVKIIRPAAGYASCPDHTLKGEILELLGYKAVPHDCHHSRCHCHDHEDGLGIGLTESYAMTPESSICGMIFMHPQAAYPDIREISKDQYDSYVRRRGLEEEEARRFLGHLLR